MTWKDITVYQWQQYVKLADTFKPDMDTADILDYNCSLIAIMYSMTNLQVESLTSQEFKDKLKALEFLGKEMEYKPKKRIQANGNWYRINYDVRKIRNPKRFAQQSKVGDVITIKQLSSEFVDNLPKIMATMVTPQKKVLGLYFDKKYQYSEVQEYSEDLLYASIVDVYSTCVFFCKLLNKLIPTTLTFLARQPNTSKELRMDLESILDGFTHVVKLQDINQWS